MAKTHSKSGATVNHEGKTERYYTMDMLRIMVNPTRPRPSTLKAAGWKSVALSPGCRSPPRCRIIIETQINL
ncbi:conserved hypothetical protein [Pectobacterium parmentieri WPP163]|nr:conserved hypothetical protein [Pectobacterium parmentieri WPP163]